MSAVYDYEPSARDDPLIRLVDTVMHIATAVLTPERAIMLKAFPFCELDFLDEKGLTFYALLWNVVLKLPDWCWGSSIKREAQVSTNHVNEMLDTPFQFVQRHMVGPSVVLLCF